MSTEKLEKALERAETAIEAARDAVTDIEAENDRLRDMISAMAELGLDANDEYVIETGDPYDLPRTVPGLLRLLMENEEYEPEEIKAAERQAKRRPPVEKRTRTATTYCCIDTISDIMAECGATFHYTKGDDGIWLEVEGQRFPLGFDRAQYRGLYDAARILEKSAENGSQDGATSGARSEPKD